jgi:hypothetical protein
MSKQPVQQFVSLGIRSIKRGGKSPNNRGSGTGSVNEAKAFDIGDGYRVQAERATKAAPKRNVVKTMTTIKG